MALITPIKGQQGRNAVRAAAKLALEDKQRAKHHEEAVTRAHDAAVCCVGEAATLVRAASKAVSEMADRTLNKLPETERYPTTRMRLQRPVGEIRTDELYQDTYTLTHATATLCSISAGVGTIMRYGAAVREAAVTMPAWGAFCHMPTTTTTMMMTTTKDGFITATLHNEPYHSFLANAPLLEPVPRSASFQDSYARYDENMHELAETLRVSTFVMYNSTDKWYLTEEMRTLGLLSASLGESLALARKRACEGVAAITTLRDHERSARTLTHSMRRYWEPTPEEEEGMLVQHCTRVCDASYQVVHMAATTKAALELEAHATQMFRAAVHKHFMNVQAADASRPGHTWCLGGVWERAVRSPRYKAMKQARHLLDRAWAAEILAKEALDTLGSEIHRATEDAMWALSERHVSFF
ncbi:hypothetical protein SCUCBS95973_001474 [Sporothrix curviconia]|uniref:Uncharacterized protein n=1 Tax=Sporothrix curviconia TaxID=1260050 RepID=A0ABP0AYY0_9PEZI